MRLTSAARIHRPPVCCTVADDSSTVELRRRGDDDYRLVVGETGKELAALVPDAWQGNVKIVSPNGKHCGVAWPHFLMNSEGQWLSDRVESEGLKLVEFELLHRSGPVIGYRGQWRFRDYFVSSETHHIWYQRKCKTQVHLIRTELEVLRNLTDITTTWVEFMTRENSYTTVAAKTGTGEVITMDVSETGEWRNMHYWDGEKLANDGWITIYGARSGQDGCAALVPLRHSPGPIHPRINNGHVDNIEIHMLDARKHHRLDKHQKFLLEYLLIAGPDKKDWEWIDAVVASAITFIRRYLGGCQQS